MKTYLVGGAVRDKLLGIESKDNDYVVVGATPEEMLKLGYSKVGASFPVFLHPRTGEEYALARTERKTGAGYHAFKVEFEPTVTLEDDLRRRDLTINSMAMDLDTGEIIDPYGGQLDLKDGVLRHTSEAFAEDPVRVLRIARFAARYGFAIAPETILLMRKIAPELKHVSYERIWTEFSKGLSEDRPHLMIEALRAADAMSRRGALNIYRDADTQMLQHIARNTPFHARVAALVRANGLWSTETQAGRSELVKRMTSAKIPTDIIKVVMTFIVHQDTLYAYDTLNMRQRIGLMIEMNAFSYPELMGKVFDCLDLYVAAKNPELASQGQRHFFCADLAIAQRVDAAAVAAACASPKDIKAAVFNARVLELANAN